MFFAFVCQHISIRTSRPRLQFVVFVSMIPTDISVHMRAPSLMPMVIVVVYDSRVWSKLGICSGTPQVLRGAPGGSRSAGERWSCSAFADESRHGELAWTECYSVNRELALTPGVRSIAEFGGLCASIPRSEMQLS
jgi:hypothetical protein